ncbi:TPA: LPXTG cell wall anchor domain-containing protein [Streptococcus agalactiae]|nr:LPXTG cell wall anchor domain-containing protein [Streptococcus agalactiae]
MSKVKVLSLITVSGLFLMAGNLSASADVVTSGGDTIMLSGVDAGVSDSITPPPSNINPVTDTIEPSAPTPSTDPITDTTAPSALTPSTDQTTGTTDSSTSAPSTDQTTDTTDSSTSAPSTEAEKPAPSKEPDAPKPITKPIVDVPISTVTGDTVIGTENGKVIVQSASGTILKDAKEVGGEVQKDGTVAIKKSDGKIEVLPNTGEGKTIFTIVGLLLIAGAVWIGFKDNIKKYLTFFKKKSEK